MYDIRKSRNIQKTLRYILTRRRQAINSQESYLKRTVCRRLVYSSWFWHQTDSWARCHNWGDHRRYSSCSHFCSGCSKAVGFRYRNRHLIRIHKEPSCLRDGSFQFCRSLIGYSLYYADLLHIRGKLCNEGKLIAQKPKHPKWLWMNT